MAAPSVAGLKTDPEADDGGEDFDDGKLIGWNDMIKNLIGNVGAIACTLIESTELFRVFDVFEAGVPAKLPIGAGVTGVSAGTLNAMSTLDVSAAQRCVQSFSDFGAGNSGPADKFTAGKADAFMSGIAEGVAPAECLQNEKGGQSDDPTGIIAFAAKRVVSLA